MVTLGEGDKAVIRHIVGNIHVSRSTLSVAKMWLKRCRRNPRELSHEAARYAIACHIENRNEYRQIMRGGF